MRPIKILLLIPHLGGGGAERVIALLARHLDPELFQVHVGVISEDSLGAEPVPSWVAMHRIGGGRVRYAGIGLLSLVWSERPDLILTGMVHLSLAVLALKPLMPRAVRILVRQNTTASKAQRLWMRQTLLRLLYPRANYVICQSEAMASDLCQNFSICRTRLVVLANPIAKRISLAAPSHAGERRQLLAVGRLAHEKGFDLLLHAVAAVKVKLPDILLTILGVGPEEHRLKELRDKLNLNETVQFAGYANPEDYYDRISVFVTSSRFEGMPNAMLEAAAAGLPIVSTPCCTGVCDLLHEAPGTWIAAEITAASLASAILSALDCLEESRTELRRFNHAFTAPFQLTTAIRAYQELFLQVADMSAS